ncbi:MAG: starch synthase [Candidatus Firestonebacteria bacterium RIFOXYA2_FULL_40_8]|nr:MAG: starch synthase [Candidatus Firestonebacteria bacterium RIFOXYA2_FULL_40_8]
MAEKEKLNILFVSSEVVPFAKTGGLADVSSALPKALTKLGCNVKVIMPKYSKIDEVKYDLKFVCDLPNGGAIKKSKLRGSSVEFYFVEYEHYFGRNGLYGENGSDYSDNAERFIFFSKCVLDFARFSGFQPDIIHCNDWQTALIPVYISSLRTDPFFKNTATVLTVHNMAYQGIFSKQTMYATGLSWDYFTRDKLEYWDQINFMKGGLVFADIINTVSETYAKEIQSGYDYGWGLEGILQNRKDDLFGILNGIDAKVWSPEADKYLTKKYGLLTIGKKLENKKLLAEKCGLPFKPGTPLLGMVSRFADQKGFDIIGPAMDILMKSDVQFIIQGIGDQRCNDMFAAFQKKYPEKFAVVLRFDERIAHLIYAGADMFLMPSRFEPCGLSQLISFKYGTVPVVRETGGLADSVINYEPKNGKGTGFVFKDYSPWAMLDAVKRAVTVYQNKKSWVKLIIKDMELDFSWDKSAEKYVELYNKALLKRR